MMRFRLMVGSLTLMAGCAASEETYRPDPLVLRPEQQEVSPRMAREAALVDLAVANSIRLEPEIARVAAQNVADKSPGLAGPALNLAVQAEHQALRDRIEARKSALQGSLEQGRKNQQASAVCSYRGRAVEAQRFGRGVVNFDGYVSGAQTEQACLDMYRRTGLVPTP